MLMKAFDEHIAGHLHRAQASWMEDRERERIEVRELEAMRRDREARVGLRLLIVQCTLLVGLLGVCAYGAWIGQWVLVERVSVGLVTLGLVIGARGGR